MESGIEGHVTISPVGPPAVAESTPSRQPYSATFSIRSIKNDREVAQVTSDTQGEFRLALPPGAYRISPIKANPMVPPYAEPMDVQVPPAGYIGVNIAFDSGIR
jgi:hypothetical protein